MNCDYTHISARKIFSLLWNLIIFIQAEQRSQSAGLGAPGSNYGLYSSSGSYKDTVKSLTKARYDQTFQ